MALFEHLILTRFNVRLDWSQSNWDRTWLQRRIELFETYCLPSVRNQTNQNFQWNVFFDEKSPDFLLEKIEAYKNYENFVPIFTSVFNSEFCRETVRQKLSPNADHVITTRLDNDDAIATDFIQNIQDHFVPKDMTFLNFLYGYRLSKSKLYLHRYSSNSFISLIEPCQKEKLKTVYCGIAHGRYKEIGNIVNIKSKPNWLILIHEDNIGNKCKGILQPASILLEKFPHLSFCASAKENPFANLFEKARSQFYYKPIYYLKDLRIRN